MYKILKKEQVLFFFIEIPTAALTGTADDDTKNIICSSLAMKDPLIISISPNRTNVRFHVFHQKKDDAFSRLDWLIEELMLKNVATDKSIIFCNTMNDIARVVNYLLMKLGGKAYFPTSSCQGKNCLIGIFHSNTWSHQKEQIMESLKGDGRIRVVVASSALSMGVNFPDVKYIINWGPARNLLDQLQEAGRAGRDGIQSHNIIIYHGQQLIHCSKDVKEFVRAENCHRILAYTLFDPSIKSLEPGHICCSHCATSCKCEGESCNYSPIYTTMVENTTPPPFLTRSVCEDDKKDLRSSLEELRCEMSASKSLFDPIIAHGFSEELTDDVVESCALLFTVDDIWNKCAVYSVGHAVAILEIIQEIFLDIPNFDETMAMLKHEHFLTFDTLDFDVLQEFDDVGDSSGDEWSDNEPIEEI